MKTKAAMRRELEATRRALSVEDVQAKGGQVQRHLAALGFFRAAHMVALYEAQSFEVSTRLLQADARAFCLPRVVRGTKVLMFHRVASLDALVAGPFGLKQPAPDSPTVAPEDVDVWVVPGVGFTPDGLRIGRGGGFYDATLQLARPGAHLVGVTFDCCIVEELPVEPHDVPVDTVVTESGVCFTR